MNSSDTKIDRKQFLRLLVDLSMARICLALVLTSFLVFLLREVWVFRDFIGLIVVFVIAYLGIHFLIEILPFSQTTRNRWARRRELATKYSSYRHRSWLWAGFGTAIIPFYRSMHSGTWDFGDYISPILMIVVGLVAHQIWRRKGIAD